MLLAHGSGLGAQIVDFRLNTFPPKRGILVMLLDRDILLSNERLIPFDRCVDPVHHISQ